MAEAHAAGITPTEFWDLTYREIYAVLDGARIAARRARQMAIFTAWHVEAFSRTKRLPDLAGILRKMEPAEVMSPRQIRTAIIAAAEAMGSRVVYKKRGE